MRFLNTVMSIVACAAMARAEGADAGIVPAKAVLFQPRGGLGNFFAKIHAGGVVNVAYFGGSITEANGWRVKTLNWLKEKNPTSRITEINAAIGGTGSDLGAFRCKQDVLDRKPDLIFVEFAVNDGGAPPQTVLRAMEGIVRQAWKADSKTDICLVYTTTATMKNEMENGTCPRSMSCHELIAEHYGIPAINVGLRIAEMARDKKLIYVPEKDADGKEKAPPADVVVFSKDGVHPVDAGHEIYAKIVEDSLLSMENSKAAPHELGKPMDEANWENAKLLLFKPEMLSAGWKKLETDKGLGKQFNSRMPELWEARTPGEKITFKFKGTVAKLYDVVGPDGGQAVVTLDDKKGNPVPRFDKYCRYYRVSLMNIGENLSDAVHTVIVELHPEQPNRESVLKDERSKPGFDPKKYDGTVLRTGGIMLLGDLAE